MANFASSYDPGAATENRDVEPPQPAGGGAQATGPSAGWHRDPTGAHELRRWNGNSWTDEVADPKKNALSSSPDKSATSDVTAKAKRSVPTRRVRAEIGQIRWEYWEEKLGAFKGYRHANRFWVSACGPNGVYTAATSAEFDGDRTVGQRGQHFASYNAGIAAFNAFFSALWADGWEPTAFPNQPDDWYGYRLRRVVQQ